MADTLPLVFQGTTFNIIERDGHRWLPAAEIARALGYAREDAITQLYVRNAGEFSPSMTLTLNLTVKGFGAGDSEKPARIFSLRGAHLLAMFARTARAAEFRRWVLDVLDREVAAAPAQPAEHPMAYKRMLVPFDHLGRPCIAQVLADDARILSCSGMAEAIRSPGAGGWSNETLLDLAEAIHTRLAGEVRRLAALQRAPR